MTKIVPLTLFNKNMFTVYENLFNTKILFNHKIGQEKNAVEKPGLKVARRLFHFS